jgi:protein-L-isoaspartate(D-aspartate) O-methyltransferase
VLDSVDAPFDKIILTCAVGEIPPALIEQLKEGGYIIAPIGATNSVQQLIIATKQAGETETQGGTAGQVCAVYGQAVPSG